MTISRLKRFKPRNGPAASAAAALGTALIAGLIGASAASAAGGVAVQKPWMRLVMKSRPAAGYFTLDNETSAAVALTGASSADCGMLMLHQSKEVAGVEKMLPVKSVTVPAHGSVTFAPGGYHLMCMSPGTGMTVGATVPVTLKFADGQTVTAQFPVKGATAQQ
jgi:periplasmic copper chaperone A